MKRGLDWWGGKAHVCEQAGGSSHVRNTLVLLQGDGLSRYIRVQAVQLGGRSLRATTPSDRAWGTRRRTSFGPVLESGVTLLVVMEFLSTGVCDTPSHLPGKVERQSEHHPASIFHSEPNQDQQQHGVLQRLHA